MIKNLNGWLWKGFILLIYRAWEFERRELVFSVLQDELLQLHQKGFVHRRLSRPSDAGGERFDNIFLTNTGISLIDVGVSTLEVR